MFSFNGTFYHKLHGVAMGTKVAPALATIFVTCTAGLYCTLPTQTTYMIGADCETERGKLGLGEGQGGEEREKEAGCSLAIQLL